MQIVPNARPLSAAEFLGSVEDKLELRPRSPAEEATEERNMFQSQRVNIATFT